MSDLSLLRSVLFAIAGVLLPSFAFAHSGETGGFVSGLAHPVSGLDHVCAMLAVGLWAAQAGGRTVRVIPLTFVGVMALGGALPLLGIGLPFVEPGIVLSVLLLGVLVAASVRLPLWLGGALVALFALWHGQAHGNEMPALASEWFYGLGFVLATVMLHVTGIGFFLAMQRLARERAIRVTGAGIALYGVYLAAV